MVLWLRRNVTLCGWSAKQTFPFSVLARNQTKAWACDLRREVDKGMRERVGQKNLEEGSWRQQTQSGSWQSTPDSRRDQSAWDRVQKQVGEYQSRWVGIPSSFVEISWRMDVSVRLHMHKECRVSQLNLLAFELNQAHIVRLFFVFFLQLPWLYFLWLWRNVQCPYRYHWMIRRPRLKLFRRIWCNVGPRGYCHRKSQYSNLPSSPPVLLFNLRPFRPFRGIKLRYIFGTKCCGFFFHHIMGNFDSIDNWDTPIVM